MMPSGANVVCFGSIDWGFNWQLPQEVASALARGNRVLYVENTGVRRPSVRDLPRLRLRLKNWLRKTGRHGAASAGVDVHSPLLVPLPYSRVAGVFNAMLMLRVVRRWLRRNPDAPLIFITFLPTPLARALIRGLAPHLVVYYCADSIPESSEEARKAHDHEQALFGEADLVLTTSQGLFDTASVRSSNVKLLPSGVRFFDFEKARHDAAAPPQVLAGADGPVAGFVGTVRDSLDLELLEEVTRLLPEWTFVLAGPLMTDVRRLASRPNVRMVGALSHQDVIRHMTHFDVGIMPYALNPFTANIMPVKLKEYLAAGLPVVATRLADVSLFAREYEGLVTFADTAQEFAEALRTVVRENVPPAVAHRLAIARTFDWGVQMASMNEFIDAALGAK